MIGCNQKNVCSLQITDTTGSHQFPAMQRLSITKVSPLLLPIPNPTSHLQGHAFLLVYSVTSRQSLEELGPIILMLKVPRSPFPPLFVEGGSVRRGSLKEVKGVELDETPIMLVGNKCDEEADRKVSTVWASFSSFRGQGRGWEGTGQELGKKLADKWGTGFIETSAKSDVNIRALFEQLLAMEKKRQLTLNLDESGKKEKKSRKCVLS